MLNSFDTQWPMVYVELVASGLSGKETSHIREGQDTQNIRTNRRSVQRDGQGTRVHRPDAASAMPAVL
jgi:hypothetical protein